MRIAARAAPHLGEAADTGARSARRDPHTVRSPPPARASQRRQPRRARTRSAPAPGKRSTHPAPVRAAPLAPSAARPIRVDDARTMSRRVRICGAASAVQHQ
jgi:hypothetical protein